MATHPQAHRRRSWAGSLGPLMAVLCAALVVLIVVMLVLGLAGGALAAVVLLFLVGLLAVADAIATRRKLSAHRDDVRAVEGDESDSVPAMPAEDDVPLGATGESHTDLHDWDLPPGHPARRRP